MVLTQNSEAASTEAPGSRVPTTSLFIHLYPSGAKFTSSVYAGPRQATRAHQSRLLLVGRPRPCRVSPGPFPDAHWGL